MNTNAVNGKKKDGSIGNEDLSFTEDPKDQINSLMDNSTDIIDIRDSPDVATWNKGMQFKGDAAIIANSAASLEANRATTTINLGLKEKRAKDVPVDPNEKDVEEVHN
ncbi:MAG TPA: hypothetical protein VFI70_01010 [Nitrososphaeraceae archaeon]|nr:hypothetical protein [Nitrososphaeraceae archaeon]